MIDKERRKKLAFHLRHLSVGLTSNDDFEENVMEDVTYGWLPEQFYRAKEAKFDDPVIQPMLELCWGLYDDTACHKLEGPHKLSEESLKIIARCILFLHSDHEYKWPYFNTTNALFRFSIIELLVSVLTLGQYYRDVRKEHLKAYEAYKKLGDYDVWPFMSARDYQTQLQKHPFLAGQ